MGHVRFYKPEPGYQVKEHIARDLETGRRRKHWGRVEVQKSVFPKVLKLIRVLKNQKVTYSFVERSVEACETCTGIPFMEVGRCKKRRTYGCYIVQW